MKLALLLVVTTACGSRSTPQQPPPPRDAAIDAPLDRDYATLAARSVAMYRDIAVALASPSCPTAQLTELANRYADVIAANARVAYEDRGAQLQAALKSHDAELAAAAKTIVNSPTLAACAQDPAFDAAWSLLVGAR